MWKQRTGDLENRWRSVDVEYSGMKEIVWGVWKERENMNADMKWLDNPEVFKVNQWKHIVIIVIIWIIQT